MSSYCKINTMMTVRDTYIKLGNPEDMMQAVTIQREIVKQMRKRENLWLGQRVLLQEERLLRLLEEIFQGMTEVTITFRKRTILVIDDEPDYLVIICIALEKKGFVTLKAYNGHQAMEQVQQMPDLILLDVRMTGGLSGFDVCQQLKTDLRYQHIPVIFCSALASEEDILRGLKAGAVEFLTKPFDLDRLIMLVTYHTKEYHFSNKGSE